MNLIAALRRLSWAFILLISLPSCIADLLTRETEIYGPYYVADDPSASYKTLFYRDKDVDLYRFENVSRVGYSSGYIFIKSENRYYWFAVADDPKTDLGDPATEQMLSAPLTQTEFTQVLHRLGINELTFQFQE